MAEPHEITVIGAGVVGLCVATELAARGTAVRILDRAGGPGAHGCSWWAGGMLAPFCEGESAEPAVVRLGQQAAGWWARHAGGVTRAGTLVLAPARDRAEITRFATRTERHARLGEAEIAALEPDLAGRFRDGLHFAEEAHLAPRTALAALARGLEARGIQIERAESSIESPTGTVIDCRGLVARDRLPQLRGVKGEMAILRCPELTLSRPVRLLHPRHPLYLVPRGEGVVMLGATQVEATERRLTVRALLELLSAAYALHPAFAEAEVLETGVDARPAFPDNLPRIIRRGRIFHVNGLFRHGFLLSPAVAVMLADWLEGGPRPELGEDEVPQEADHAD